MHARAVQLLEKERICVLAVPLADDAPHGAVMHYSSVSDPVTLYFQTSPSVKTDAIAHRSGAAKASVVVGLSEADFVTLQMRGEIRTVTDKTEIERITGIHYRKLPQAEKHNLANGYGRRED